MGRDVGTIGKSVIIKGELSAEEDLTIEGQVEGKIELDHSELTIGPNGRVTADVLARAVIVMGTVSGNITATEKINLRETASVDGDLVTPSLGIAEGASVRGQIDVQRSQPTKVSTEGIRKAPVPSQPAGGAVDRVMGTRHW